MIQVMIEQSPDERIHSFTVRGHANFDRYGSDIVCAGVSTVTFGTLNAVEVITGVVPDIEQDGEEGYLHWTVPDGLPHKTAEQIQLLLRGMLVSLQTIEESYGDYVKISFKQREVE